MADLALAIHQDEAGAMGDSPLRVVVCLSGIVC